MVETWPSDCGVEKALSPQREVLDARSIAAFILALEENVKPQNWTFGGVRFWPLIRNELYIRLSRETFGASPRVSRARAAAPIGALIRNFHTGPLLDDLWLVNDGASYQRMGAGEIDRLCTPLAIAAKQVGLNPLMVDVGRSGRGLLQGRVWLVAGHIFLAKALGGIWGRVAPVGVLRGWVGSVNEALASQGVPHLSLSVHALSGKIRAVLLLAGWFGHVFKRRRPKAIFAVSYYGVVGYAVSLAARRCGVPAIDVQHGVAGHLHMAYGNWSQPPKGGYDLLPRGFWTWSSDDAAVIEASFRDGQHRAIAAGHPYVEAWRSGLLPGAAQSRLDIEKIKGEVGARINVLVTLQPGLIGDENLAVIADAMRFSEAFHWWLRLHPMALDDVGVVESYLREAGLTNYNINDATRLPLYAVIEACDAHMTHSSSTVIEAAMFGLPSIVWSDYGAAYFDAQISGKTVVQVANGAEAAAKLPQLLSEARCAPITGAEAMLAGLIGFLDMAR